MRSSARSSCNQAGSVQVVLPAAELPAIAAAATGAPRAQLPPELGLPRRAPAAVRTPPPSASCSRLRPPPPPPPLPLGEDESGLHISTSELKGETEEGGGGQAFLRHQTLKACRSQGSSWLRESRGV